MFLMMMFEVRRYKVYMVYVAYGNMIEGILLPLCFSQRIKMVKLAARTNN
jgi:hypothetical protein